MEGTLLRDLQASPYRTPGATSSQVHSSAHSAAQAAEGQQGSDPQEEALGLWVQR